MLKLIKRVKEAREAAAKELAENPEDSSSGKPFKKLYKLGDQVGRQLGLAGLQSLKGKPFLTVA